MARFILCAPVNVMPRGGGIRHSGAIDNFCWKKRKIGEVLHSGGSTCLMCWLPWLYLATLPTTNYTFPQLAKGPPGVGVRIVSILPLPGFDPLPLKSWIRPLLKWLKIKVFSLNLKIMPRVKYSTCMYFYILRTTFGKDVAGIRAVIQN